MSQPRFVKPSRIEQLLNRVPEGLARLGLSVYGSRILAVRGRRSGEWRTAIVNLLEHGGARYLVAPRGEAQWVCNLRALSLGELRLGRRSEPFRAVELSDGEKPEVLRAYLRKWRFEVGIFFEGVGPEATDEDFRRIAPGYPVFRIETV